MIEFGLFRDTYHWVSMRPKEAFFDEIFTFSSHFSKNTVHRKIVLHPLVQLIFILERR